MAEPDSTAQPRLFVGCMTGTSLDGLDTALVRITGEGLGLGAEFLKHHSMSLPGSLTQQLAPMTRGEAVTPLHVMRAARHLGVLHAQAITQLLAQAQVAPEDIDAAVCHGQTVWHAPQDTLSWQLFDPWPIVQTLRLPVCYDLRQADLIAGGQGAPITPAADEVLFGSGDEDRLIVNLGGICNVTFLGHTTEGEDIGPCNLLLDGFAQRLAGVVFDEGGKRTAAGTPHDELIARMGSHPWFEQTPPRSTGREDFDAQWIDGLLDGHEVSAEDALASAAAFIAQQVHKAVQRYSATRVVLAGGGALNAALVQRIEQACAPVACETSETLGVPVQAREAAAMAVLGALSQDSVPITYPQITGATAPGGPGVAGAWVYP